MGRTTRVLHLVRPAAGGMRRYLDAIAPGDDGGSRPSAFLHHVAGALNSSWLEQLQKRGIPALPLAIPPRPSPGRDRAAVRVLQGLLAELQPDILHCHGVKAAWLGREAVRRRPEGGEPPAVVCTVHGIGAWEDRLPFLPRLAERRCRALTDAYIAVSQALGEHLRTVWRVPPDRVHVVANGIDAEAYPPPGPGSRQQARTRLGLPPDGAVRLLAAAARLAPEKGLDTALRMLALLDGRVHLAVAGDGPERARLQRMAGRLGLCGRVHWLGRLDDVKPLYHATDVVLLPSRREGFGLAAAEAMACAKPVIASAVGGLKELIQDGSTGLLLPPDRPPLWAAGAARLLEDELLARRLGAEARNSILRRYPIQRTRKRTEMVYRLCMLSARRRTPAEGGQESGSVRPGPSVHPLPPPKGGG